MCGRYFMDEKELELRQLIAEANRRLRDAEVKGGGEVRPTDTVPVIAPDRSRRPSAFAMRWGCALPDGRRVINARSETAADRPLFRDGMARRRCAVPASGYYEWARQEPGRPKYAIRDREQPMIYMAGVYRLEDGLPTFAILTRPPRDAIAFIHDRMPVLLPREAVADWLDAANDPARILARVDREVTFEKVPGDVEQLRMPLEWD